MVKNNILLGIFLLLSISLRAQLSTSSMSVLTLPASTKASALGGENISTVEDNAEIVLHNPALLANVSHNSVGLDFMSYADGSWLMGAQYVRAFGERHTGAAFARYLNYGKMTETLPDGSAIGHFTPQDVVLGLGYSYLLNDYFSGGANLKFGYSGIADFSALALGVDVGLNYYNPDKYVSASLMLKNVGVQMKNYADRPEGLPFSLQAGVSVGLGNVPIHINLTLTDLTSWSSRQYFTDKEDGKVDVMTNILNHVVLGADYVHPSNLFWLGIGYNVRRGNELAAAGSSAWAGLTAGGGLNFSMISLGFSYQRYSRAYSSFMGNIAYRF